VLKLYTFLGLHYAQDVDASCHAIYTCQAVAIVGTAPLLMASTYASVSAASMGPVMMLLFMRLGWALWKMTLVSSLNPCNCAAASQAIIGHRTSHDGFRLEMR